MLCRNSNAWKIPSHTSIIAHPYLFAKFVNTMMFRPKPLTRPVILYVILLAYYWTKVSKHEYSCNSPFSSLSIKTLTETPSVHHFLSCQRKLPVTKESNSYLCLLLLVTSADINPNLGTSTSPTTSCDSSEASTYYPCGTCHRHVTWEDRAVCCEDCYCWYHIDCHNIHSDTYENLKSSSVS